MNRTPILLAAGAVAIVLVGVVAYYLMSSRPDSATGLPADGVTTQSTGSSDQTTNQSKSLKDLMGLNQNQQCTFSDDQGNTGKVYIGQGKMRGDFASTVAGQETNTHMIVDGETAYMWIDGQTTGYQMSMDAAAVAGQGESDQPAQLDLDKQVDYSCNNWGVDASMFIIPAGVEFTNLGMLTLPSPGADGSVDSIDQCAACTYLPAEAQDQCKTALGCN